MRVLTHADAFQALLLQAADDGRGPVLFGESLQRARTSALPFLIGKRFPSVYLEHPLIGQPFMDVTMLYSHLDSGTRIESPAAAEHGAMVDFAAQVQQEYPGVSFGFELDTKAEDLPVAAVHFQPRRYTELVEPFFKAAGEQERAKLYLNQAARMPKGWPLAFFGMFRGRPNSPLRMCGYLDKPEREACGNDTARLAAALDTIGFTAYDDAMLAQVSALMAAAPRHLDFQIGVFPDGSLEDTFAIDIQFEIEQPQAVFQAFDDGPGARVMQMLQDWGVADERWKLAVRSAFARAIPVELDDGSIDGFALTLTPQWVKARWTNGVLQPSKLYHLARAALLSERIERPDFPTHAQ